LLPIPQVDELLGLIKANPNLQGLNVTIPYKQTVIPFLNEVDIVAQTIGAVNCIAIKNSILKGYNTDAYGFQTSVQKFLTAKPEQAFVLGTGGSAQAVQYVLSQLQIPFVSVSRNPNGLSISYAEIETHLKKTNLIINTTPLGMYPHTEAYPPIPYHLITDNDFLFDLIYNPAETKFMQLGKQQGAQVKNGYEMLELQAEKSWEIWKEEGLV
jgi:shikimate dehydrogenase